MVSHTEEDYTYFVGYALVSVERFVASSLTFLAYLIVF